MKPTKGEIQQKQSSNNASNASATRSTKQSNNGEATGNLGKGSGYLENLGEVNRHWYRRRLDGLDAMLRKVSRSPGLKETNDLCEAIITGFLTAVTGQGRGSNIPQFPSDRACFIPFDGDKVGKFQYAKSYYQFSEKVPKKSFANSLWSFYPILSGFEPPKISDSSVDERIETISLKKMLSVGEKFDEEKFTIKKSLLLNKGVIRELAESLFSQGIRKEIRKKLSEAIISVFGIYKETPGNTSVELILFQHLSVIRWLYAMLEINSNKVNDFDELFRCFLRSYFVKSIQFGHKVDDSTAEDEPIISTLLQWLIENKELDTLWHELEPFEGRLKGKNPIEEFKKIKSDLKSFRTFLREGEKRLEEDLDEILSENPLKAGQTKTSFVWVVRDYADFEENLPDEHKPNLNKHILDRLNKLHEKIINPLIYFFHQYEIATLRTVMPDLNNYWRTRGQAARQDKLYASFNHSEMGIIKPGEDKLINWSSERPQNVFVRVRVSDSLNESQINGLFIFSSDRDELKHEFKDDVARKEDAQDLLSFSKVFFFIVRDYFYGQDRSRDASDIGKLNQHLFEKRLNALNTCMETRAKVDRFEEKSIINISNWDKFIFALLNNYAFSLIDQPTLVSRESFPYDRLVILPHGRSNIGETSTSPFFLPFFYFQSIFLKKDQNGVDGKHYSFIKPFQSPVDKEGGDGFARTFQKESEENEIITPLSQYLEKHYLGGWYDEVKSSSGKRNTEEYIPDSYVTKTYPCKPDRLDIGSEQRWTTWALEHLWEKTTRERDGLYDSDQLWRNFLKNLTMSFQDLLARRWPLDEVPKRQLWFLYQFSFLRIVIEYLRSSNRLEVCEHGYRDKAFNHIHKTYSKDLKLQFNDQKRFNILLLAGLDQDFNNFEDPFETLYNLNKNLLDNPLENVSFVLHEIEKDELLILFFLECLTKISKNHPSLFTEERDAKDINLTWYQPLLTRPIEHDPTPSQPESCGMTEEQQLHFNTGLRIGKRTPPYEQIRKGEEKITMFLGVVNIQIGETTRESRPIRCLIAALRDYDDTQSTRVTDQKVAKEQLKIDVRDLSLYSNSFFSNAENFMNDSISQKRLAELSREIPQIGRNWYSKGVDRVVGELQKTLQDMVKSSEAAQLNQFQPALTNCLFEKALETLLGPETGVDRQGQPKTIEVESFPFDRLIHIPLYQDYPSGASLSYARTYIADIGEKRQKGRWKEQGYDQIRRLGRTWDARNGKKTVEPESLQHLILDESSGRRLFVENGKQLSILLKALSNDQLVDGLISALYESNRIQALSIMGLIIRLLDTAKIYSDEIIDKAKAEMEKSRKTNAKSNTQHLKNAEEKASQYWDHTLQKVSDRLREVLLGHIQGLEREENSSLQQSVQMVQTKVHMERNIKISRSFGDDGKLDTSKVAMNFSRVDRLPIFNEFFKAMEGQNYLYGLDSSGSKIFFVYYSISVPDNFIEMLKGETHFRGVFCFILDDAATDDKSVPGERSFSDSEIADREDIRTFIHNTMGSLRLIFNLQGLQSQLNQPGIDQFIIGMLHRLKNELGKPSGALHDARLWLENPKQEEKEEILSQIEEAETAIYGIKSLFSGLKELNDIQGAVVPLQKFTSNWLGCQVLQSLCRASLNILEEAAPEIVDQIKKSMEKATLWLNKGELEDLYAVKREYFKIERALESLLQERKVQLALSFQVFSTEPLSFRGSHFLGEAINTLVENAFQAFWSYIRRNATGNGELNAHMHIICRPSEESAKEILIEISNSSNEVDPVIIRELNAKAPAPISTKQHARKSGKKGGSGFGHYYARRIVSMYCGGKEARRSLDVSFQYNRKHQEVKVIVNLAKPDSRHARQTPADQIARAFFATFKEELREEREKLEKELKLNDSELFYFPGDMELEGLFEMIRQLLSAEREIQADKLSSLVQDHICGDIKGNIDIICEVLESEIEDLISQKSQSIWARRAKSLSKTLANSSFNRESYSDLKQLRQEHGTLIKYLTEKGDSDDQEWLDLINQSELEIRNLISHECLSHCDSAWSSIRPYFNKEFQEMGVQCLAKMVMEGDERTLEADREAIENAFKEAHITGKMKIEDSSIRFVLRFHDGEAFPLRGRPIDGDKMSQGELKDRYRNNMVGRMYLQYQESLRAYCQNGEKTIGQMYFDIHVPECDSESTPHRTVYLELSRVDEPTGKGAANG